MKVILQRDVAKVGRRFDIVDVPSGHAQNFLIPRGIAIPATEGNLRKIAEQTKRKAEKHGVDVATFQEALQALQGATIEMPVDANPTGGLFKGIKAEDIAEFLASQGHSVSASLIILPQPIKHTGTHAIELNSGKHTGTFSLVLVSR